MQYAGSCNRCIVNVCLKGLAHYLDNVLKIKELIQFHGKNVKKYY